jgi:Terminase RNaseH-like domain
VLVILDKRGQVVFVDRFHRLDWSMQVARIKAAAKRYNDCGILVDTTGAGEPVYESMCEEEIDVSPYPFTARSKAALVNGLAIAIEQGQIVLPTPELWPEGIEELEAFEYTVTERGTTRTEAPGGMHDDCVMALGLAWANLVEGSRVIEFGVL